MGDTARGEVRTGRPTDGQARRVVLGVVLSVAIVPVLFYVLLVTAAGAMVLDNTFPDQPESWWWSPAFGGWLVTLVIADVLTGVLVACPASARPRATHPAGVGAGGSAVGTLRSEPRRARERTARPGVAPRLARAARRETQPAGVGPWLSTPDACRRPCESSWRA